MTPTPLIKGDKLKNFLGLDFDIYYKREDKHPLGSHKGRSLPQMIEHYVAENITDFVISSSGNAALAAALYISARNQTHNPKLTLKIFVGKNIPWKKYKKLKKIKQPGIIEIIKTERPKQQAILATHNPKIKNLRQSTDPVALMGYIDLARELNAEIPGLAEIFIPTSSGTTAVGLARGWQHLKQPPKINIIQTATCHPFISSDKKEKTSLAGAIVDKVGYRRKEIQTILARGGEGFVADNKEIKQAIKLVKKYEKIKISPNSALSVAGLLRKIKTGQINGPIVCLFTGE